MKDKNFRSGSEKETIQFGEELAKDLKPGDIVCLEGELGAGKTTLVKGIAKGLKIKPEEVHSPTFVFLNIYSGKKELYHFDLYRIENTEQINQLGYEEFFYGAGVTVIEWAERLGPLMPNDYWDIKLKHDGKNTRLIWLTAKGNIKG